MSTTRQESDYGSELRLAFDGFAWGDACMRVPQTLILILILTKAACGANRSDPSDVAASAVRSPAAMASRVDALLAPRFDGPHPLADLR